MPQHRTVSSVLRKLTSYDDETDLLVKHTTKQLALKLFVLDYPKKKKKIKKEEKIQTLTLKYFPAVSPAITEFSNRGGGRRRRFCSGSVVTIRAVSDSLVP